MRKFKQILFLSILILTNSTFAQKATIDFLPNMPYDKYNLKSGKDTNTFYLSISSLKKSLPLIVFIQGSGMNSLFTIGQNGQIRPEYGHMTWFNVAQEKCRILIIEKPGVNYTQFGESKEFDENFSLESWSEKIVEAISYVTKNENIDTNKILIAGHSEGGVVTSRVANIMKNKVSNVAILAGEGPSQLYSLYKFAENGTFFNTTEHAMPTSTERINYVKEKWLEIIADPNNTNKKFWGFTYLRWSSMLNTSVINELLGYNGKILLVQGASDKAVYPESANIAYTALLSKGKNVELDLIENADHSFNISDKPDIDGWKMVLDRIYTWFMIH